MRYLILILVLFYTLDLSAGHLKSYKIFGGGHLGDSPSFSVTTNGSQVSVTYSLLKDGVKTHTIQGKGQALSFDNLTQPGRYTVEAKWGEEKMMMDGFAMIYPKFKNEVVYGGGRIEKTGDNFQVLLSSSQKEAFYNLFRNNILYKTMQGDGEELEFIVQKPGIYTIEAQMGNKTLLMRGVAIVENYYHKTKSRSYQAEYTYLEPFSQSATYLRNIDLTYLDGFGRPVQKIMVAASPDGDDIITSIGYGKFNSSEREFLPYCKEKNGGAFVPEALLTQERNAFYGEEGMYAFTEKENETSSFGRILKESGPGKAWHMADKHVRARYRLNRVEEVRHIKINANGRLYEKGYYPANVLQYKEITDEDGNISGTYFNEDGQEVVKQSFDGSQWLKTYYVYDHYGRECFILSPEFFKDDGPSLFSEELLARYAYQYKYDKFSNLIEKRLPGTDWIKYIWDARNRMVLSQDGNQSLKQTWSYTLYDLSDRVTETGEVSLKNVPEATLREQASVSHDFVPSASRTPYEYFWYDTYSPPLSLGMVIYPPQGIVPNKIPSGVVTATRQAILGTNDWICTTYYYDEESREIQKISNNTLGGLSKNNTTYDFMGNVMESLEEHGKSDGSVDKAVRSYRYDHRSRLVNTSLVLNNAGKEETSLEYDGIGRLITSTSGNGINSFSESYTYNIRGWLTGKSSDFFKMSLNYHTPTRNSTPRYNGNISEWIWQQKMGNAFTYSNAYTFEYDGVNRLTGATFHDGSGQRLCFTERGMTYDRNGNIQTLERTSGTPHDKINLGFDYTGYGNRLKVLTGLDQPYDYIYDLNGNLNSDNRQKRWYFYNHLNLLKEARLGNSFISNLIYLADGTKLEVNNKEGNGYKYLGSMTYKLNGGIAELEGIHAENGRILRTHQGSYEYKLFLKDHLGSIRTVVDINTGRIEEQNDYYPFGLQHPRTDYLQSQYENRDKFSGKEKQTTTGTNLYDFSARNYDPFTLQWTTMDPLAEKYVSFSPYAFCLNNPVLLIDPNGMDVWSTNDPGLIAQFLNVFSTTTFNSFESFNFGSWNHVPDDHFVRLANNLYFDDKIGTFTYTELNTIDGEVYLNLYKISTPFVLAQIATVATLYGKENQAKQEWAKRCSGGIKSDYTLDGLLIPIGRGINILGKWVGNLIGKGVAKGVGKGTHLVYEGLDAAGNVKYIGITGRNAAVRFGEHLNSGTARSLLDYRVINGATGLSKTQARIWEQTLINQYGLGKNGGLLLNKVNSITPKNWWQYGIK